MLHQRHQMGSKCGCQQENYYCFAYVSAVTVLEVVTVRTIVDVNSNKFPANRKLMKANGKFYIYINIYHVFKILEHL